MFWRGDERRRKQQVAVLVRRAPHASERGGDAELRRARCPLDASSRSPTQLGVGMASSKVFHASGTPTADRGPAARRAVSAPAATGLARSGLPAGGVGEASIAIDGRSLGRSARRRAALRGLALGCGALLLSALLGILFVAAVFGSGGIA